MAAQTLRFPAQQQEPVATAAQASPATVAYKRLHLVTPQSIAAGKALQTAASRRSTAGLTKDSLLQARRIVEQVGREVEAAARCERRRLHLKLQGLPFHDVPAPSLVAAPVRTAEALRGGQTAWRHTVRRTLRELFGLAQTA